MLGQARSQPEFFVGAKEFGGHKFLVADAYVTTHVIAVKMVFVGFFFGGGCKAQIRGAFYLPATCLFLSLSVTQIIQRMFCSGPMCKPEAASSWVRDVFGGQQQRRGGGDNMSSGLSARTDAASTDRQPARSRRSVPVSP